MALNPNQQTEYLKYKCQAEHITSRISKPATRTAHCRCSF